VAGVHWLDLVAEVVNQAHHGFEVPAFATHALPYLEIILEGPEGDQRVVG